MRDFLAISFLLVSVIGCTAGFIRGADEQQAYNDRAELARCQEGYTAACKKWQRIMEANNQK